MSAGVFIYDNVCWMKSTWMWIRGEILSVSSWWVGIHPSIIILVLWFTPDSSLFSSRSTIWRIKIFWNTKLTNLVLILRKIQINNRILWIRHNILLSSILLLGPTLRKCLIHIPNIICSHERIIKSNHVNIHICLCVIRFCI